MTDGQPTDEAAMVLLTYPHLVGLRFTYAAALVSTWPPDAQPVVAMRIGRHTAIDPTLDPSVAPAPLVVDPDLAGPADGQPPAWWFAVSKVLGWTLTVLVAIALLAGAGLGASWLVVRFIESLVP